MAARTILLLFVFLSSFIFGQKKDSVIQAKYYKNGKIKEITYNRGVDTFEIRKYYKNGQLGDSVWICISEKNENSIGIEKSYFEDGKLSSITYHGKEKDDYVTDTYRENGMIYSHIVKPTGVSKYYNSKGDVIKQFDENKFDKDVYVSKRFRNYRHLKGSSYASRIQYQKAYLTEQTTMLEMKAGVLISLILKSDTIVLNHCQVEGFATDSIYISKFDYNNLFDRVNDFDILKYEKTFAVGIDQIKTIIYSKHYNKKRAFGAQAAFVVGTELEVFPILFGILLYKNFIELAPYYAASVVAGVALTYYSKYLYRSMVPKTYDMQKWKLKIQP